ncbi:uncharacterized protein LOC124172467 [Ischnura elegans]|uniref:uncharacterized protein LOC124172467 n=1 Tax=Ischnura elegans TaxID=197161 RepID=UPI001ED8AC30|nr:uncharacterized protein LOC124172467 [Ischnura elegans]
MLFIDSSLWHANHRKVQQDRNIPRNCPVLAKDSDASASDCIEISTSVSKDEGRIETGGKGLIQAEDTIFLAKANCTPRRKTFEMGEASTPRLGRQSNVDEYDMGMPMDVSPIKPFESHQRSQASIIESEESGLNPLHDRSRSIVQHFYMFSQIFSYKHQLGCSFMDCEYVGEWMTGLLCHWKFKCKMCGKETVIHSQDDSGTVMDVNDAAVTGTIAGGGGYSNLSPLCAALNMHCMTAKTYAKYEDKLGEIIYSVASQEMATAGQEERRIALEEGSFDKDGRPVITVIADGMWGKRSYKTKYDSLSGQAAIVGARTKKVLFLAVRNKYCSYCALRETRSEPIDPAHKVKCAKNWDGSSTSMEADIIAEGFAKSESMHNLIFHQLVGSLPVFEFNCSKGTREYSKQLNTYLVYNR